MTNKRFVLKAIGISLILLCSALLSSSALAEEDWKPVQLKEVYINYKNFMYARDPLFYNSVPKTEINFNINTDFLEILYFNNKLHTMTNYKQFYVVGWNFFVGMHLGDYVDVQYEHYSKHLLDDKHPYAPFPFEDSVGINIHLYKRENRGH